MEVTQRSCTPKLIVDQVAICDPLDISIDLMNNNFQQILRFASDALSIKYSLSYASIYWQNNEEELQLEADLSLGADSDKVSQYSISPSMMGAIIKPLVIVKAKEKLLQILIPLTHNNTKIGFLAFWGPAQEIDGPTVDKQFLEMLGLMVSSTIQAIQNGELAVSSVTEDDDFTPVEDDLVLDDEDEISFIDVDITEEIDDVDDFSGTEVDEKPPPASSTDPTRLPDLENIKLFLDVSKLGFMVFDNHCKIETGHALFDPTFFGVSPEDQSALDILFQWGEAINRESASFETKPDYSMILDLMKTVFARITDIDVLKEMLPKEINVEEVTYGMEYHYLKSVESIDNDRILAVFRDISNEKDVEFKYQNETDRANMVIKVALDIDGYYQYKQSTEKSLEMAAEEFTKDASEIDLNSSLHLIQAIQGGAEIYEMNEITHMTDSIISQLENLRHSGNRDQTELSRISQHVELLKDRFELLQKQYLDNLVSDEQILDKAVYRVTKNKLYMIRDQIIESVINKRMNELELVFEKNYKPFTQLKSLEEITQKRLGSIKKYIRTQILEPGTKEIDQLMSALRRQPIGLVFKRYAIIAVNLGDRMNKRVEVEIKGAEIEVPFHRLEHLFSGLTFVIRNCVEHGLESMEERINLDKSLEGNIKIEALLEEDELLILITDDGRGIDVKKIRDAAVGNELISVSQAGSYEDEDILKLMFTRGFSTKKDSQGTFGRGVGLNAVGSAVEELGGSISIQTALKKGTSLQIKIPLQSPEQAE